MRQERLAEKKKEKTASRVYIVIYIVKLPLSPLVLIRLSILLVCGQHGNHDESFINSGDRRRVEFAQADRARKMRVEHTHIYAETYRSITSSGRYFSTGDTNPHCSSRDRVPSTGISARGPRPRSPPSARANKVPTCSRLKRV